MLNQGTKMKKEILVKAQWDDGAQVWVAESEDVPGLITESKIMKQLVDKLKILIPELLEANGILDEMQGEDIPFHLFSKRLERIHRTGHV